MWPLDMKGNGADEICNPSMGMISFRITSCSPSPEGSPALVSSLRKAAILFWPKYRDSFESSSSGELVNHSTFGGTQRDALRRVIRHSSEPLLEEKWD
jgi:hypothetical protein